MTKDLKIVLKVDAKTGQVTAVKNSFDDLDKKINKTNTNAGNFNKTLLGLAGGAVVIMGISKAFELAGQTAKSFLDTGSKFEQYSNGLSSFYVGQDKLNEALAMGRKFASDFNVSIDETFESMHLMKVYGIDASAESLEKYGNIAKGSMKSISQFVEAMADAFMGENERLKEFGVKASVQGKKVAYAWTDSSGKARSVVIDNNREMIESTLLTIYNEKYVGQMAKYAGSWAGFVSGIETDYNNFQISVMNAGLMDHIEATAEAFYSQWTESFGDTGESAKIVSDYMSDLIDGTVRNIAFLIDAWTGVKLVFNVLRVGFFGLVSSIGDGINWIANKWGKLGVFMHNTYKSSVDGMGETWYEFMNFLGVDIEETAKMWNSFTGILGEKWNSMSTVMADGFSNFTNFVITKINSIIDGFMGLGNDVLDFLGFDKLEKVSVPLVEFKKSIQATKEPLNVYVSDIEKAVHSTSKLVDFKFSNSIFEEAKKNVSEYYSELENNSAQVFVNKLLEKQKDLIVSVKSESDDLIRKEKEAKAEMEQLLGAYAGKLPEAIKKGSKAQTAHNALLREAKQLEKEQVKEAKRLQKENEAITKGWEKTNEEQIKAFDNYTKSKNDAYKEYLRIIGDYESLDILENEEKMVELKPYLTEDQLSEVEQALNHSMDKVSMHFSETLQHGVSGIFDALFSGGNISDAINGMMDQFNTGLANIFSDALSESITKGTKTGSWDLGVFNEDGSLSDIGTAGAVTLGNMFSESAFGGTKNGERGREYGQMAGMAIGAYFGSPALGAMLGGIVGGAIGSAFGGKTSYRTRVNADGTADAIKHKSGGIFGSSSNKVVGDVTYTLQAIADQYENFLLFMTGYARDLELGVGTYSDATKEYNRMFFNAWAGASDENASISLSTTFGVYNDNRANFLSDIEIQELRVGEEIKKEWENYAKSVDKEVGEVLNEVLGGFDATKQGIFNYVNRNDQEALYQNAIDRGRLREEQLESSLAGGQDVTLENFGDLTKDIKDPVLLQRWSELGQVLVSNAQNIESAELYLSDSIGESTANLIGMQDSLFDFNHTSEEITIRNLGNLESKFKSLGFAMPKSTEEFYDLMLGLDASTESGRELINSLSGVSSEFLNTVGSIEKTIEGLRLAQDKYRPAKEVTSDGIYNDISNYSSVGNQAIETSIQSWHDAQISRLEETATYQVTIDNSHNEALNEQRKLVNDLGDKIRDVQRESKDILFDRLVGDNTQKQAFYLDASLATNDWDGVQSAYGSIINSAKTQSGTESDYLSVIANANAKIQAVEAPERLSMLDTSVKTMTYTRDISGSVDAVNRQTVEMYDALIDENERSLATIDSIDNATIAYISESGLTREMLGINFEATNAVLAYSATVDNSQNEQFKEMSLELKSLREEMSKVREISEQQKDIAYEDLKIKKVENAKQSAQDRA